MYKGFKISYNHPHCDKCKEQKDYAVSMAVVRGSVGATSAVTGVDDITHAAIAMRSQNER